MTDIDPLAALRPNEPQDYLCKTLGDHYDAAHDPHDRRRNSGADSWRRPR